MHSLTAGLLVAALALALFMAGCSKSPIATTPKTIEPATAALSPPAETPPAGEVLPLGGNPQAAVMDAASGSLVVFTPGINGGEANLTVFGHSE